MTRATTTFGIMMPADMGSAIARMLSAAGLRTVTSLEGRSARTRALSDGAGVEDLGSDAALVSASDVVLSIVSPDVAPALAERLASAIGEAGRPTLYVDCNAVSPDAATRIGDVVTAAGGRFVDAGIIGLPPRRLEDTRIYASGPHAGAFVAAVDGCLDVRPAGPRIGDASAVKMCYAALTKGSFALMTQLAVAAERLGISDVLTAEFAASQGEQLARMRSQVPAAVPKAFRWVAEMEEIARTFESAGVTGLGFDGAARTYAAVAGTSIGRMRVEEWREAGLSFDEVVDRLANEAAGPD